ncbi:MAG: glutaredoxin family protein [Aggregatilineales bacterium]
MTVEPVPQSLELIMYSRETPCPFVSLARRVLAQDGVPYRELFIDRDKIAERRVLEWTGFLSVPTLIAATPGETLPYTAPTLLAPGSSPRGIDRGAMITEPDETQLRAWLRRIGMLNSATS